MKNSKFFSFLCAMALVSGTFLLPSTANAGHWSVNIGVPVVVAAPAPAVVYSAPVAPVVTVVQPAPVIYPRAGYVITRHPSHHYYRGGYRGRPRYHHGHR